MKCLLCRIQNQHSELMKHPNQSNLGSLQVLWDSFNEIINTPPGSELSTPRQKDMTSILGCGEHVSESGRDRWFDDMNPKMRKLIKEGIKIRRLRVR